MDEKKMQAYFNFNESDLEANRKGRLSPKQKKQFIPRNISEGCGSAGMGLFMFLVAGLGMYGGVAAALQGPDWGTRIIFGLGFGIFWPLVWGGIGWVMIKSIRPAIREPRVKAERGPLHLVKHEAPGSIPYYEVRVGEFSAETDNDLTDVVAEGEQYALYYLQKTGKMVSLEHISKSK
jgi:hypothetical protein